MVQEIQTDCIEAWLMLARLQLARGEMKPAQNSLEKVSKFTQSKDPYVWVSLGQCYQKMCPVLRTAGEGVDDPATLDLHKKTSSKALDCYRRALKLDPSNLYAANGIGCVLADRGNYQEANEMFTTVRVVLMVVMTTAASG